MIIDIVHTENTEGNGGPQADFVGECESSEFKRNLNGGPQADGGGEQVLITDGVHTENTDDTDVRRRTVWGNVNHRNLNGI